VVQLNNACADAVNTTDSAHSGRLLAVARHLIVRSFPRLRQLKFAISWGADEDLLYYEHEKDTHRIYVNDCFRSAPRRVLEGGIAHELCHIDADMKMGRYQRELAWERYMRSRWYRMREEWSTDKRVIALGYGPQLLAFVCFAQRLGSRFTREYGLRYAEIVRIVESERFA
jgi:hypothetical protein